MHYLYTTYSTSRILIRDICSHPQIVVDDFKVCELYEFLVVRQRAFDDELGLAGVGLELVTELQADATDHNVHKMLHLKR